MIHKIKIKDLDMYQDTEMQSITFDSILLSEFVKINSKVIKILDIGAGNGIISLLLSKKTSANVTAVEILEKSCELAILNAKENNVDIEVLNCDIKEYAKNKHQIFDVIVSNPPYFIENNKEQLRNSEYMQIARNENDLKISDIISISNKLLKNNGHLYLIFRCDRLDEIITYFEKTKLRVKVLKFVYTKEKSNALFCLLDAIKGANRGLVIEESYK